MQKIDPRPFIDEHLREVGSILQRREAAVAALVGALPPFLAAWRESQDLAMEAAIEVEALRDVLPISEGPKLRALLKSFLFRSSLDLTIRDLLYPPTTGGSQLSLDEAAWLDAAKLLRDLRRLTDEHTPRP
ncbi:MAG: hypothetical protein KIT73_19825 [Burkholderiales bacterium]|nr:hypothetical protein [Burkholderiales bacterium]